ncbi:MAG: sugar phosphate isomerase/epimerase [Planctomycetia bacterium]|nr:sugar phosphate isomerase/epimerase [Planctomycetia bacterium]
MLAALPTRRQFLGQAAGLTVAGLGLTAPAAAANPFRLRYALASCMYGTASLADVLPEVNKTGAEVIDLWPRVHGNQREQLDQLGFDAFEELLKKNKTKLGVLTRYDLGPLKLQPEMAVAQRFGASIIVTGSGGSKELRGDELKTAIKNFVEQLKPQVEAAAKHGVTIAIENHGNTMINRPESLRWLAEFSPSKHLGIALAPYHLPQDPEVIAGVVRDCGPKVVHFYAWEHGKGAMEKRPVDEQLMQLPGRGPLDFTPILAALKKIDYAGWTEIFMHPVPRGVPILESTAKVSEEINRVRQGYLARCLEKVG